MEMFSFIKECLFKYNYPLVHSMSEEEMSSVFKTSNRCFLISWMLKLLDVAYKDILENHENDKTFLSNLVYELGFCAKTEKLLFMTGEMPVSQQVTIIFNFFTYINDVNKSEFVENQTVTTIDDLLALANVDLNLFPMYGDIKTLNTSERNLKLLEFGNGLNDAYTDTESNTKTDTGPPFDSNVKENLQEFMDNLKIEFPNVRAAIHDIRIKTSLETPNSLHVDPNSVEIIKKFSENLKIISQFVKDIGVIEEFEKHLNDPNDENSTNTTIYEMIKILHQEVLSAAKYIRCS